MLIAKIIALIVLAAIFVQDIVSRAVHWILFPVLVLSLVIIKSSNFSFAEMLSPAGINLTFLIMQLLLVTLWFSIKQHKLVNITSTLLGWGDILLLTCLAFYLSVLNFLMFYLGSLIFVLVYWTTKMTIFKSEQKHIPLAGLQALLFLLLMLADTQIVNFNLVTNDWILKLINL